MTKRLQVLFDDVELAGIQRVARRRRMSTAEWVRQALRAAHEAEAGPDVGSRLEAIRAAVAHAFPVGDVDDLLREIEDGYLDQHAGARAR